MDGSATAALPRYAAMQTVLGPKLWENIVSSRVLVVGAGGIGCELIKNLVLAGFSNIDIIDLDTIDLSNLNRQFLFKERHVGMSKSKVARESALSFNPHVKINAHYGNVKSPEFGIGYVKQFTMVMNALDNLDARRHVNRVCLAADVPLIESGTEGYLGQTTVIRKGVTECFECTPKTAPKKHAVCTIRSTPSKPIHCIVWAKYLFGHLFGEPDDENAVTDLGNGENGADGGLSSAAPGVVEADGEGKDREEGGEGAKAVSWTGAEASVAELQAIGVAKARQQDELNRVLSEHGFPRWVYHKVFVSDVETLLSMKSLWQDRTPPTPLRFEKASAMHETSSTAGAALIADQRVWSVGECTEIFLRSVVDLQRRREERGPLSWDKDDTHAMDFVAAASNLRMSVFGMPLESRFTVKSEAGNIIPAIATSNAVIAGLIVSDALKILQGQLHDCRSTFLLRRPSARRVLLSAAIEPPKSSCYVCSSSVVTVRADTGVVTVGQFIEAVLKKHLCMVAPSIMVGVNIVYEEDSDTDSDDEGGMDYQIPKPLAEVGIKHNSLVRVVDYMQDFEVEIAVEHAGVANFEDKSSPIEVSGTAQPKVASAKDPNGQTAESDEDDVMVIEEGMGGSKRTGDDVGGQGGAEEERPRKKTREAAPSMTS